MKRRYLLWFVPIALIAVVSVPLYRSLTQASADPATIDGTDQLVMMSSHATGSEREHEIKALQGELEKNPDHIPILLRLAQVSRDSGKLQDSVRYLREAVAQNPKNTDAGLELGRALFEAGDIDGAIRATEHVLEINPTHVDALYNLGAIYGNLSQDIRAREYWEKAAALGPKTESGRNAKENLQKLR